MRNMNAPDPHAHRSTLAPMSSAHVGKHDWSVMSPTQYLRRACSSVAIAAHTHAPPAETIVQTIAAAIHLPANRGPASSARELTARCGGAGGGPSAPSA